MDKMILNNTIIDINTIVDCVNGLMITFIGKQISELETLLTKENLSKIEISTGDGEVYRVYNNMICDNICKNLSDASITANLIQLDDTKINIEKIQVQIFELTSQLVGGGLI